MKDQEQKLESNETLLNIYFLQLVQHFTESKRYEKLTTFVFHARILDILIDEVEIDFRIDKPYMRSGPAAISPVSSDLPLLVT